MTRWWARWVASSMNRKNGRQEVSYFHEIAANWEVPFWLTDAAMATQNLLLIAEERGLGALYFGILRNARLALDALGVPEHVMQVGAVALGWRAPTDKPSGSSITRPRRTPTEVVHRNHW